MDDLQGRLREDTADIAPSPGGFEATMRRIHHRERWRRVVAAGVALVLTIGGSVALGIALTRQSAEAPPNSGAPQALPATSPLPPASDRSIGGGALVESVFTESDGWLLTCDSGCSGEGRDSRGRLLRVDPQTGRVDAAFGVKGGQALAAAAGRVWFLDFWNGLVVQADPARGTTRVTELELSSEVAAGDNAFLPFDVAVGEGGVWVSSGRGEVARLSPATNEVMSTTRVPPHAAGHVATGEGAAWVAASVLGLVRIDATTATASDPVPIDGSQGRRLAVEDIVVSSGAVWAIGTWGRPVGSRQGDYELTEEGALARLDPVSLEVLSLIAVPPGSHVASAAGVTWVFDRERQTATRISADGVRIDETVDSRPDENFFAATEGALWLIGADGIRRMEV